jgi:hypothetical protein
MCYIYRALEIPSHDQFSTASLPLSILNATKLLGDVKGIIWHSFSHLSKNYTMVF